MPKLCDNPLKDDKFLSLSYALTAGITFSLVLYEGIATGLALMLHHGDLQGARKAVFVTTSINFKETMHYI